MSRTLLWSLGLVLGALVGSTACTYRPRAVHSEPISIAARELLECAVNETASLGFEIRGQSDSGFGARRRIPGPGAFELQDVMLVGIAKGSDGKVKLVVSARSYEQHREAGAPTYLTELHTLSSDARRAAYDVERTCSDILGAFAADTDVGQARGLVTYDPQEKTYTVAGSGQNMWDVRDDFHFVWKRISGNFVLSTRARFIGAGVEEHRKIGWTIRPSLEPGSAHVTAALHGNGLMSLQFRRQTGAITEEEKSADSLPDVEAIIQLERRDGAYFMSVARVGDTLVTQRLGAGVLLPDTVYVGLFVCSHNATVTERAIFSNVQISRPPKRN